MDGYEVISLITDMRQLQLGVQIMDEEDQLRFGFDLLDPTKIVPEEYVPVTPLGKMQLNRNPLNYFSETEQVMVRYFPFLIAVF